jgi:hypothetical protein
MRNLPNSVLCVVLCVMGCFVAQRIVVPEADNDDHQQGRRPQRPTVPQERQVDRGNLGAAGLGDENGLVMRNW